MEEKKIFSFFCSSIHPVPKQNFFTELFETADGKYKMKD